MINEIVNILEQRIPKFSYTQKLNFHIDPLESRALLILALSLHETSNHIASTRILLDLFNAERSYELQKKKIDIKILINLSYNYFILDDYWNSLLYTEKGINLCLESQTFFHYHDLLARKSILYYRLKLPNHQVYADQCISLLLMQKKEDTAEAYKSVFENKYGFKL